MSFFTAGKRIYLQRYGCSCNYTLVSQSLFLHYKIARKQRLFLTIFYSQIILTQLNLKEKETQRPFEYKQYAFNLECLHDKENSEEG